MVSQKVDVSRKTYHIWCGHSHLDAMHDAENHTRRLFAASSILGTKEPTLAKPPFLLFFEAWFEAKAHNTGNHLYFPVFFLPTPRMRSAPEGHWFRTPGSPSRSAGPCSGSTAALARREYERLTFLVQKKPEGFGC